MFSETNPATLDVRVPGILRASFVPACPSVHHTTELTVCNVQCHNSDFATSHYATTSDSVDEGLCVSSISVSTADCEPTDGQTPLQPLQCPDALFDDDYLAYEPAQQEVTMPQDAEAVQVHTELMQPEPASRVGSHRTKNEVWRPEQG